MPNQARSSPSNNHLKIKIQTQSSDHDSSYLVRIDYCDTLKSFIENHVPELLVEIDSDGARLGDIWLYSQTQSFRHFSRQSSEYLQKFSWVYSEIIVIHLCLVLINIRASENNYPLPSLQLHFEHTREAIAFIQAEFEKTGLLSFVKLLREKINSESTDVMKLALKSYVRYRRKESSNGVKPEESIELAILMRSVSEIMHLIPPNQSNSNTFANLSALISGNDYNKPLIVRGWPNGSVYYREIRDPRFRRFRS